MAPGLKSGPKASPGVDKDGIPQDPLLIHKRIDRLILKARDFIRFSDRYTYGFFHFHPCYNVHPYSIFVVCCVESRRQQLELSLPWQRSQRRLGNNVIRLENSFSTWEDFQLD